MTPQDPRDDRELQFHLEMLTQRYLEEGLDPAAARERALARMGDLQAAAAARRAIDRQAHSLARHRHWRGWSQDVRHAWRVLRRSPGFVVLAVLMLGLATGAGTAVFSVVDAVLIRSAFADPDASAFVRVRRPNGQLTSAVPRDVYERLSAGPVPPLSAIGLHTIADAIATQVDTPRRTETECVSPSVAAIVGTRPALGRWFTDDDARAGAPAVAVISHKFWRGTLGGDPAVLGRIIALDDEPVTVIGVMPAGFNGPFSLVDRDIWVPYGLSSPMAVRLGCRPAGATVNAVARLQPGVSVDAASAALSTAAGGTEIVLESMREGTVGDLEHPFNALVGAVAAVLLIAFANVTNFGLERLAGRRREVAVRLALGATRARIVRETVAEHVLVALAGALAGVAIAVVGFEAMVSLLPASLPNLDVVSINTRVLLVSIGLALLGGAAAGCVSAWQISAAVVGSSLAAGERGHTDRHSFTRRVLVTAELALGVLLLVGALLMIRTFLTLRPAEPGFDVEDKYVALIRLPPDTIPADRLSFIDAMSRQVSSQPGIRAVAATTSVPMRRSVSPRPATIGESRATVYLGSVTPNYFEMMRMPILRGRGFTDGDRAGAPPVAVVNETFAARWFAETEPIGMTFTVGNGGDAEVLRIVGVLGDTRSFGGDTRTQPFVYRPLAQSATGNAFFMIDAHASAASTLPATVRRALTVVRPDLLVDEVERLADEMDAEVARPRLGAWLFGSFAGLAVLLAAVGLAATLAWSVTQRRREIGIRMALGASAGHVRRVVLGQTLAMALTGIALGLLGAAWATRLLAGWLYGVSPLDPLTFAACGAFMLGVALLAAWLPTRRASRVDPVVALRGDA
jgi:putative ABC transport system permease protein